MLLNDRLNMETLGCTKCGGEISDQICNYRHERGGRAGERSLTTAGPPDEAHPHTSLMVLTEMLYNLCVTGTNWSTKHFQGMAKRKARLHCQAHLCRGCKVENETIQPVIIKKEMAWGRLFTPRTEGEFNTPTGILQSLTLTRARQQN